MFQKVTIQLVKAFFIWRWQKQTLRNKGSTKNGK